MTDVTRRNGAPLLAEQEVISDVVRWLGLRGELTAVRQRIKDLEAQEEVMASKLNKLAQRLKGKKAAFCIPWKDGVLAVQILPTGQVQRQFFPLASNVPIRDLPNELSTK